MKKIPVAILGATGSVGQRFIQLLEYHPWFEVVCVAASSNSSGKTYKQAVNKSWTIESPIPKRVQKLIVKSVEQDVRQIASEVRFVFSALNMDINDIKRIEKLYASLGIAVVSNNSAHRWTEDVPMIMPEINPEHIRLIDIQRKNRGWGKGFIAVKPNCSIQSYVSILTILQKFIPTKVNVVSLQAISGAGKTFGTWPEMIDNAIPYIEGEEEKSEKEPLKIWGEIRNNKLIFSKKPEISASCIRIPTLNGHIANVSVSFTKKPTRQEILEEIYNYKSKISNLKLPSAPKKLVIYLKQKNRPQIRLDRNTEQGMGITMGRLQKAKFFDWKFTALSHNTIRGGAGGAILLAELLTKQKYIC